MRGMKTISLVLIHRSLYLKKKKLYILCPITLGMQCYFVVFTAVATSGYFCKKGHCKKTNEIGSLPDMLIKNDDFLKVSCFFSL